jgi:Fe-S oxidoreductase
MCTDRLLLAGEKREGHSPRAFSGALHAVVALQMRGGSKQKRLGWITSELEISDGSEKDGVALFVGCAPYYDALLAEAVGFRFTSEAHAAVVLLNAIGIRPVLLPDEVCCGNDRLHAGERDAFIALGTRNRDLLRERSVRTIVTTCNDCRFTLERRYPLRIPGWDFEVMSVTDFLVSRGAGLAFMPTKLKATTQPPDRYSDPNGVESVRRLLSRVPELVVNEFESGHPSTFGSWNQFGAISRSIENAMLKAAESTGAERLLVQSTRPLVRLLEGRRPGSWEETSIAVTGLHGFLTNRHAVARDFGGA